MRIEQRDPYRFIHLSFLGICCLAPPDQKAGRSQLLAPPSFKPDEALAPHPHHALFVACSLLPFSLSLLGLLLAQNLTMASFFKY